MTSSQIRRIVGCPGGGLEPRKTRKLSELAARAADKYGPREILIASLTKAAAKEIGGRVDGLPDDATATLHAHALRALEFDHEKLAETPQAMREFHDAHPHHRPDGDRDHDPEDAPAQTGGIHAQVTNHRARMTPITDWTDEDRDYHAVWQDWCRQTQRQDFTTLIERCISEHVPPLGRQRVILADEAQDFTKLEFTLLAQWAQDTDATVMVGDTQQAIYQFRGADPERLEQVPVAHGETLAQSYRCPRAVAAAAQAWAAQLPGEPVAWEPRDADGQVAEAAYALRDTDNLIDHALSLDGTTMILATCRYMLQPLTSELRARGVAHANPWATTEAAWNPLQGPGPRALLALLQPTLPDGRMWTWADLHTFTDPMQATALPRGAKASIKEHCREDEFKQTRAGDEVPLGTLATLLGEDVLERLLAIDRRAADVVDWWHGALLARNARSIHYAIDVWRTSGVNVLRPAHDPQHVAPVLTVGTIHSTKGAEAQHVLLCPEVSKEAYHTGWHGGQRDPLIRTMYVAMTRASEALHVMEPGCPEALPIDEALGVAA